PAPRGVPQIEVTFDLDANGILNVSAKDKATGKEQKITITASSGLSKDEVEKLQREAESHAAEDAKRREEIELRNQADTLAYSAERTLREHADKVPAELKSEVESNISDVRSALQGTDVDALRQAVERLNSSMQKIGQAVYAGATPGAEGQPSDDGQQGPQGQQGQQDEGTVEGEFREV
ncbi:MAG: Hsp70 family protein, partial [Dehalococcoidia bacterium]